MVDEKASVSVLTFPWGGHPEGHFSQTDRKAQPEGHLALDHESFITDKRASIDRKRGALLSPSSMWRFRVGQPLASDCTAGSTYPRQKFWNRLLHGQQGILRLHQAVSVVAALKRQGLHLPRWAHIPLPWCAEGMPACPILGGEGYGELILDEEERFLG